jgi:hypothetical protein
MSRPRRASALGAIALFALVFATFAEALLGSRVFFQRDILSYWYPGMAAFREAVAEGSWPLWNPRLGFGAPLLADASFQIAYPPTWLVLVLSPAAYFKLFAAGHCLLAGLGALLLGRRLGLWPLAASVGGAAYALSGPLLSAVSLFHHYAGAAWMPWVLAALVSLLRRPGPATALGLGLAAGAQLLAGSGDLCLATGMLGVAGAAWYLVAARPSAPALKRVALAGALAACLAGALGALQWLPTARQAALGSRPGQGEAATYWSLHPLSLVDLAVPRLVSDAPLGRGAQRALFESRSPLLAGLYLGVTTLVLGILGLAGGGRGARLSAAAAAFFLLASLGRHTPLYTLLEALPGFALMRYPQKHLLPAALCVALLAAFGAAQWRQEWERRARARAFSLGGALAIAGALGLTAALALAAGLLPLPSLLRGAFATPQSAGAAAIRVARSAALLAVLGVLLAWRASRARPLAATTLALLLLGALDLVAVGRGINPLAPRALVEFRPPLAAILQPEAARSRVQFVLRDPACGHSVHGPAAWDESWKAALASVASLKPPSGVRFSLFGAFDGQFTGLEPRFSLAPMAAAVRLAGTPPGTRLLEIANVGRVLWLGEAPAGSSLVPLEARDTGYGCPLRVLAVPDPLPRAYVVGSERQLGGPEEELRSLLDASFDPRREVLLPDPRPAGDPGEDPGGRARVVARTANTVEVEAEASRPAVLVLVEAYDDGFRARVDGRRTPVLRANALFRGVRLPAGRHRVLFVYRPWAAVLGAWAFALGLVLAAALGAWAWRSRGPGLSPPPADGSIGVRGEEGR